jgi:hypothetical protein
LGGGCWVKYDLTPWMTFGSVRPMRWVLDYFTEKSFHRKFLTERPFDRNIIWPNTVWPNAISPKVHSIESPFNRTPFDRKFILPKGHMTDFFFEKMVIWPNLISKKNVIWQKVHLTESSFDRKCFLKMIIWPRGHSTESRLFIFH